MSDIAAKIQEKLSDKDKSAIKALSKEGLKKVKELFKKEGLEEYDADIEHDLKLHYKMKSKGDEKAVKMILDAIELWEMANEEAKEKGLSKDVLRIALDYGEKIGKIVLLALI